MISYPDTQLSLGGPRWFDAMALIERAVAAEPGDGLTLIYETKPNADLLGAVVRAWQRADLDGAMVAAVVDALMTVDITQVTDDVDAIVG